MNSHGFGHKFISGFSMLELVIVLAIMSILAMVAMPSGSNAVSAKRINESVKLVDTFKSQVSNFYRLQGRFPVSNEELLIPEPDNLKGNYVTAIYLENGTFHIELGNKIRSTLHNKVISILPIFVPDSPASPISWICGFDQIPEGMQSAGENRTSVPMVNLPIACR